MSDLYIGLMSGTSTDAVDAVLIDFSAAPLQLIATHSEPMPELLKKDLTAIAHPGEDEINRVGQLDIQVGKLFATVAQKLLNHANISARMIRAIGSHGQTIRHQPNFSLPFTLQIGDPNTIAEITGITTVADFRRRDMASGGQGAPLVPAFHNFLFRTAQKNRVIVNIGGIANITLLPANFNLPVTGFDTGPGNTLLDAWIQQQLPQKYDRDGEWAASGNNNPALLATLLADDYFKLAPPKSTGKEYFNLTWLAAKLPANIAPQDVQNTLTQLTANTILAAIKKENLSDCEIFVCGGGVHNKYLMQCLTNLSPDHSIHSTAELGVNPNWVEAMAFAWLAKQTIEKKPGNLPTVTGAKQPVILGGIYQASS